MKTIKKEMTLLNRPSTDNLINSSTTADTAEGFSFVQKNIAFTGYWDICPLTNSVTWSTEMFLILGLDPKIKESEELFFEHIHDEDVELVRNYYQQALYSDNSEIHGIIFRIVTPNKIIKQVQCCGKVTLNYDNTIKRVNGTLQDISDRLRFESELMTTNKVLEQQLQEQSMDLSRVFAEVEEKQRALTAKDVALNEILSQISSQNNRSLAAVKENVETIILPFTELLEDRLDDYGLHVLDLLRKSLRDVISPLQGSLGTLQHKLSLRERQICSMIRSGYSSKQIANTLSTSAQTVIKQRKNIRKKVGINNQTITLFNYLLNLEAESSKLNTPAAE